MFHEDLAFSKRDMQGKERKVWTNKIWELCAFFPKDFWNGYFIAKCVEAMIATFQKQSPSKPVNLDFCYTLQSPGVLFVKKKLHLSTSPQNYIQLSVAETQTSVFFNSPGDSKVQPSLCSSAKYEPIQPLLIDLHMPRTEYQEWKERKRSVKSVSFS